MKKFDIKWLLILVLVVILAFGLVACNKGGKTNNNDDTPDDTPGGDTPVKPTNKATPQQFFAELWTASKSLGATVVDPTRDKIKISVAGDMEFTSDKVAAGSTDIGLEAGIIVDLKAMNAATPTLGDTALKIKFFDNSVAAKTNWLTLWYFFSENNKLYFQVQEEYFQLAFDAYWNDQFTTLLGDLAKNWEIGSALNNVTAYNTILDVINGIARSGGSDWSLDKLIIGETVNGRTTSLLGLFGLNLTDLLENDIVKSVLKIDTSKGVASLGDILQTAANIVLNKDKVTKETKDGITYYTANGLGTAKGILNGMVDNLLSSYDLALSFGTDGTKFHGFTIAVNGIAKDNKNTSLKINLTEMAIDVETRDAKVALGQSTNTFKSNVEFSVAGEMNLENDTVVINPNNQAIGFGTYAIKFNGSVDLVGAKTENKTAAELQIIDGKLTTGTAMLTATYKNNTLSIKVNAANATAKKIMIAGLPSLADAIKKAAVGEDAEVPFKLFADMADDVMAKAFTSTDPYVVNEAFTGVEITGVDIKVLAKGMFYAIFQNTATKIDTEKNVGAVAELETYKGDVYKLGTKYYKDSQYAWSLNILNVVNAVINAISYNATTSNYTFGVSNIYDLLSGLFKDGAVQAYKDADLKQADTKTTVAKPADVTEMMALFMCTNDGLLKELTNHGILPLYKDGITTKYISSTYSPEQAAAEGYYYVSGKMISKADAIAIWNYICGNGTTKLNILGNGGSYTYYNFEGHDKAPEKDDEAGFLANSLIQWFFTFIRSSSVLTGAGDTPTARITKLAGTGSAIAIDLNKNTGNFGAHIALNGKECNGTFDYDFKGTNTAYATTFDAGLGTDATKYTTVALNEDFYTLFNAAYGSGFGTSVEVAHGKNKSIYYVANVITDAQSGDVTSYTLAADHTVIILTSATECKIYKTTGLDGTGTYTLANGVLTVNGTSEFDVYGDAFLLAQLKA